MRLGCQARFDGVLVETSFNALAYKNAFKRVLVRFDRVKIKNASVCTDRKELDNIVPDCSTRLNASENKTRTTSSVVRDAYRG